MCKEKKRVESELQIISTVTWQDKPYTAVKITAASPDGTLHHAYGFSKVQYPDEWNAAFGLDLAIKKALAKIARRIVLERSKAGGIPMGKTANGDVIYCSVSLSGNR